MQPYIGYAVISTICVIIGLVAFGKVNQKYYPFLLYGMAVGIILITTLSSQYTVLADAHLEYYYARLHAGEDVWIPTITIPQGATIGSTIIAPWLSRVFHIPLIRIFTVVYPALFAIVPVILYYIYRKWLDNKKAFLASTLCIVFPAFFIEVSTITRQMLAEVVLAFLFYLIIVNKWELKYKVPLIIACGFLLTPLHYAVGLITIGILGTCLVMSLILRYRRYVLLVLLALIVLTTTTCVYLPLTGGGHVFLKLGHTYNQMVPDWMEIPLPKLEPIKPGPAPPSPPSPSPSMPTREYYESLMQAGLGFDFLETNSLGKVFRILQWAMFVLIGIGLWYMRKNKEYWVLTSGFILITALCLVPGWASLLNSTRFVHLSLFLLAPLLVVGKKEHFLLLFLIPYFLFTSGLVFEVTKQPSVASITIPYSIGLSDYRMDLGATFTEDDIKVRDYMMDNNLFPITSDVFGAYFISDIQGSRGDLNFAFLNNLAKPEEGYIFVRSRNVKDGTFTVWNGIGCRKFIPIEAFDVDINNNIVFQSGDARILEVN